MTTVNEINQIYCNESIIVNQINMTSLLFIDNKAVSKSRYSIVDNFINLLDPAENNICLYQHKGSSNYYEYNVSLKSGNTVISGRDVNGNILKLLNQNNAKNYMMVFVDGYKLLPSQFEIDTTANSVTILNTYTQKEKYTVIIYISTSLQYLGEIENDPTWNYNTHSFTLDDYTYLRYLFFKNGELITRDYIHKTKDIVTINVDIREHVDIIEYYRLPIDTENVLFYADPGYFSYGPEDISGLPVPEIYDAEVNFQSIVRLAIDDVRPGFFIREKDGNGCLMLTGDDFETQTAYCTIVVPFSKDSYSKSEYFIQVPDARSILYYISEYDLKRMLMPEILGSFQKLLLNETYDSIQRLKNTRSINKVSSSQIGNLMNFMGLTLNSTNLELDKKHAILEELTNFYKVVGTRESYNFYNTLTNNAKIVGLNQLFTPIKDINDIADPVQRYVDFRTAEELGAKTYKRYDYPFHDLGQVDELARITDSFTNQPRYEGILNYFGYETVGSPTITEKNILTNLTLTDYLHVLNIPKLENKDWEINVKFKATELNVSSTIFQMFNEFVTEKSVDICLYIDSDNTLYFDVPKTDGSDDIIKLSLLTIVQNRKYYIKIKRVNDTISVSYSYNGIKYYNITNDNLPYQLPTDFEMMSCQSGYIGISHRAITDVMVAPFHGNIYLGDMNIYVDNSLYWEPVNKHRLPVLASPRKVVYAIEVNELTPEYADLPHIINEATGQICVVITDDMVVPINRYIISPTAGPNEPSIDFGTLPPVGSHTDNATSWYDFGLVSDVIKGKWVEWTVWDRPTNWYPTNHVDVDVQIPPYVEYETFMTEFRNTFYNIASAVLYIHSIIEVYTFGKDDPYNTGNEDEAIGGGANFDMLSSPTYYTLEYTFTNDPARQDYRG